MVAGPGSCGGGKLRFLEPGLSSQGSPSMNYTTSCCVSVGLGLDFPEADSEMEVWAQKFVWFFFLEGRVPLGSIPVRQERKQDWTEGEAGMPHSNPRAPAHTMGTSGAAMPLQSGPELGEEGLSLRMPLFC